MVNCCYVLVLTRLYEKKGLRVKNLHPALASFSSRRRRRFSSHDPEFGERKEKRGSDDPPIRHALSGPQSVPTKFSTTGFSNMTTFGHWSSSKTNDQNDPVPRSAVRDDDSRVERERDEEMMILNHR